MKGRKFGVIFLMITTIGTMISIIPITLRKKPIKDWIIVYLFNAFTNGLIDNTLTNFNIVKYPVRLLPKLFKTSITFDFFVYPLITIMYNQWTYKDNPLSMLYKVLIIALPMLMIELWAEKKTSLIKWGKGWSWYHTYYSIVIKSLLTRLFIGIVRKISKSRVTLDS